MLKRIAALAGGSALAIALAGGVFGLGPARSADAVQNCIIGAPLVRAQTTVSAPYGVSSQVADLLTVKTINNSNTDCYGVGVVIHPREGTVFNSIVSTTGGWECTDTPGVGNPGDTICYTEKLAKYSSDTIRVQYNRISRGSPVSGTASADLFLDCYTGSDTQQLESVCAVN